MYMVFDDLETTDQELISDILPSPYIGLMDELDEMIAVIDSDMRIVRTNLAFLRTLEAATDKLAGKDVWLVLCPDQGKELTASIMNRMRISRSTRAEIQLGGGGPGSRIIDLDIKQVRSNGSIDGWILTGKDLTDRGQIVRELEEVRDDLSTLFEGVNECVLQVRDGKIIDWNRTASTRLSFPGTEMMGLGLSSILTSYKNEGINGKPNSFGDIPDGIYRCLTRDGRDFPAEVHAVTSSKGSGYVFIRDVTSQIKKETRMKLLAEVVETTDDAIIVTDGELVITSVNRGLEAMFGEERKDLVGKTLGDVGFLISTSRTLDELSGKISRGETWSGYVKVKVPSDEEREVSMMAWPIMSATDHGIATIIHLRDITDRLSMERNLELMSSLLSHDVKNFDRAITDNLEMLKMGIYGELDDRKSRVVDRILGQSRELNALLKNARSILQSWEGEVKLEPLDLRSMIHWAADMVSSSYSARRLEIEIDLKDGPVLVMADMLLKDVFQNLIDNSMKNSVDDTVISIKGEAIGPEGYRLYIKDNGKGIPVEMSERLFDRFTSTGGTGSGLGLYLVKRLIERYGGSIELDKREDACFRIDLVRSKKEYELVLNTIEPREQRSLGDLKIIRYTRYGEVFFKVGSWTYGQKEIGSLSKTELVERFGWNLACAIKKATSDIHIDGTFRYDLDGRQFRIVES